ncbi:hypothetical protein [Psychrilyobacter sp.]|uniref:hypothetical protein n=1 Tax=Psychrilyobacter sp. TaxID=2586924 RepID=UPI00301AC62F
MVYVLLIVSFAILIKGVDVFIEGSSVVAKAFKIPELIIGIVIVRLWNVVARICG